MNTEHDGAIADELKIGKRNKAESNGTKQNQPVKNSSGEVVTESTVSIPLKLVYSRFKDLIDGEAQGGQVKGGNVLVVAVEKRQVVTS